MLISQHFETTIKELNFKKKVTKYEYKSRNFVNVITIFQKLLVNKRKTSASSKELKVIAFKINI